MEWGPEIDAEDQLADILNNEVPIETVIAPAPQATALDDDRPVNEYYLSLIHISYDLINDAAAARHEKEDKKPTHNSSPPY